MDAKLVVFVPLVLFMVIVAPTWIVMHYRSLSRSSRSLNDNDREVLESMLASQDRLVDRIASLERILDADHPQWRQHDQQRGGNHG